MANFTFVTHKGARPERSELVRSHVMRESQRRRREAKQRRAQPTSNAEQPSTITVSHPRESALSGSWPSPLVPSLHTPDTTITRSEEGPDVTTQDKQLPPFSYALNLATTEAEIIASSTTGSVFDILPFYTPLTLRSPHALNTACPALDERLGAWKNPADPMLMNEALNPFYNTLPTDLFDDSDNVSNTALTSRYDRTYFFQNDTFAAKNRTQPVLIPQPDILYPMFLGGSSPEDATWLSPRLYEWVVELTSHYTSTLYFETPGVPAVNPTGYWLQKSPIDVKILLSCALFYSAYHEVIQGEAVHDHHYFKGRFLRLINKALEDPVQAISDNNLATIISMCMYENVRGTELAAVHLKGLRHMIDMRGGIDSLPTGQGQHIGELALLQDMIHASCSNCPPVIFEILAPILRNTSKPGLGNWYPQSPLHVMNDTGFLRPILEPQSSFEILKDAFDVFEIMCIEAFDKETACDEAEVFKMRRDNTWTRLVRCEESMNEELPSTSKEKAEYAIGVAARIHYRAVVGRVQHEDEVNTEDLMRLHDILRKIPLGFWKVAHYVYVWVLLTGGAASCHYPKLRSYFVSEIIRLGVSIGLSDWPSFRQLMGNFLWLQHYLRKEPCSQRAHGDILPDQDDQRS